MLDIAGELTSLKIEFESQSDDKLKTLCPYHDDDNPSLIVYTKSGTFHCFVCKTSGPALIFLSKVRNEKPAETRKYIQQKYGISLDKTLPSRMIEDCHLEIFKHPELVAELHARAVNDELISKYRLGYQNNRITIPIPNIAGFYISLRLYSPGAKVNKFISLKGYGGNFLFPHDQIEFPKIVIVGGEIKAIACAAVLNPHGYGVITGTTGEGQIEASWVQYLEDKDIYVVMDIDDAGRKASRKICHMISNKVSSCYDVELPFTVEKGGPDDFIAGGGCLLTVLKETKKWEPDSKLVDDTPKDVTLSQAFSAKESGNRSQYKCTVSCVGQNVYHIPKTVCIKCDKQQDTCTLCLNVFPSKDSKFIMHPESQFVLETAGCSKVAQIFAVRDALDIPQGCQVWKHEVLERYSVEDVRLSPELEITQRSVDREMQPAFIVKDEEDQAVLSNETYIFTGRTWPSPKNQEAISVISNYNLAESALDSYKCKDLETLQVFQPLEWTTESLKEKLNHIYTDFEANVSRIFQRRELYLVTDLTYHSPLFFNFDGREQNGWVSSLIIGDSSQGKSEVTRTLMEHYRLGELVECGSTTSAGILGGLDKIGGTHFITWGILAQHDKRALILDELSEANDDLLGKMNDARSRGVIQITKIKKARAKARVRLICISNPPRGKMTSYNYGIDAIKDLIPHPQYIRRFDLSVLVNESEVDGDALQTYRPKADHIYTSDLCNELLLWAWTIQSVKFEDESQILDLSVTLTKKYSEDVPLVDKGSMRLKLARLAAACAARTYSIEEEGGLLVRKCHVEFVYDFIDKMYSKPTFGYATYSNHVRELDSLKSPDIVLKQINILPFPRDFVEGAMRANNIDVQQVLDTSGLDRSQSQAMLSFLVRYRALRRGGQAGRSYYKTSEFTECLKKWQDNGVLVDKPDFIPEGKFDTL